MKKKILLACMLLSIFTMFQSCKKEETNETLDAKARQFNDDANDYKSESDQVDNDINNSLSEIPAFGKGQSTLSSPLCGVTIDSSQISQKILFFIFDGITPCFSPSRTRSGQIKVQLTSGNLWSDPNSVLTLTYDDFKITRLSDNKSIMFNGIKTLKNINGNDWFAFLMGAKTLKYQARAFNIQVTFGNGETATWNSARVTEWTYAPATTNLTFSSRGDTSLNGFSNVDSWGINRYGTIFTTFYNTPWVSNTYCGLWRPTSGDLVNHIENTGDFHLTLGVDQSGNASTLNCAYGYKVAWTNSNGNTYSVVLSY